jgi:hypothetical protein
VYLKEPPPQNIVAVENELIAPIHNSSGAYLEKPLVAVADLITRERSQLKVQEFKTSGRSFSEFEAQTSLQADCYFNASLEVFGEPVRFEYVVLVKTKTPRVQRLETVRTVEDMGRFGDLVQTVDRAVQLGIFFPHESPLNCSSCPYRAPCRDWGRGEKETELIQLHVKTTEARVCLPNSSAKEGVSVNQPEKGSSTAP